MILWTIQSLAAWRELQEKGVLRARTHHLTEQSWLQAYCWMTHQMRLRIGPPPETDCQALWTWYQWDGARKKPDLRCRGHLPPGERAVRLELECSADQALLSDFSLWHYVLNYWYLPSSEAEGDVFESELADHGLSFYRQKPVPHDTYHRAIVESWDRVFDLGETIQATLWQITIDQVREYHCFTAR